MDLRTNPLKEGGDDGRGPNTNPWRGHPKCYIEATTRVIVKEGSKGHF